MTTTAPGTHGFHGRQLVITIGVAAIVLVMAAIGLWLESDTQVSVLAPSDVSTEIVTPEITPYSLTEALADGKLDAGFVPAESNASPVVESDPEIVVVAGQGGLYDALIEGKLDMGFDADVRYVRGSEVARTGLWAAYASGQLEEGWTNTEETTRISPREHTMTLSGGPQE
jgi:hypothetical protein